MSRKLLSNFFTYSVESNTDQKLVAWIKINAEHEIFKGHFPENPVTPGVTQIEILRQILCKELKKEFLFSEAKDIKYLSPIIPPFTEEVKLEINYSINENKLKANCIFSGAEKIFTKVRGTFSEYD